jgi:hypothetical protein
VLSVSDVALGTIAAKVGGQMDRITGQRVDHIRHNTCPDTSANSHALRLPWCLLPELRHGSARQTHTRSCLPRCCHAECKCMSGQSAHHLGARAWPAWCGADYIPATHVKQPQHRTSDARCWLSRTTTAKASRDSPCTSPPAFSFSSALWDACSSGDTASSGSVQPQSAFSFSSVSCNGCSGGAHVHLL